MGKRSKKPSYSTGTVSINGQNVATVTKDKNGSISGSYNMTKQEKDLYDNVQSNLQKSLENLYNFSDEDKKLFNKQLDTYRRNGLDEINSIYTPMETNLKNDVASRFGNLDNSVFLDKLSNITNNKAKAVASLSDAITMKQDELYSNEIKNRMNYISLLSGVKTDMNNQIYSYLNFARANADSGNNYNLASQPKSSSFGGLLGSIANIGSTFF